VARAWVLILLGISLAGCGVAETGAAAAGAGAAAQQAAQEKRVEDQVRQQIDAAARQEADRRRAAEAEADGH
jgi:hypothetical protein